MSFLEEWKMLNKKSFLLLLICAVFGLTACGSSSPKKVANSTSKIYQSKGSIRDTNFALNGLNQQYQSWRGTRYRLGGNSRKGVDCSGFMQITFRDLFGISLPRTTSEQAKYGKRVSKSELRTGDLVFFNTGRGPNGKHVGVYVRNGQFLHASTKGGIIYSDINSPYWSRTFWQGRRL